MEYYHGQPNGDSVRLDQCTNGKTNYMRYLFLAILWCSVPLSLVAQIQQTVYQSFDFPDTVRFISFQLYGDYTAETWPGDVVMSETRISLYNGSRGMLDYMLKNQRYELEATVGADSLTVGSVVMERPAITTSKGQVTELLDVRLFVPRNFIKVADHLWRRQDEDSQEDEQPPQNDHGLEEDQSKHEKRS